MVAAPKAPARSAASPAFGLARVLLPDSRVGRRALLAILVLAFALRAFKLTTLLPILGDESIYLRWAEIIDHQGQWYISLLDGKQPLQPWILALQRMLWDADPLAGARLISVLAGLGSTVGVFAIGKRLGGDLAGIVSALFYACFPLSLLYDRLAYTEAFVNLAGVAIVLTSLWAFSENGRSWKRALVPATALAVAMLTKQTLILFAFVPALIALLWGRERVAHTLGRLAVVYAAGAAAFAFCILVTPEAPTLESHDAVFHHAGFFASPSELLEDPFKAAGGNTEKLLGYFATYMTWPAAVAALAALAYLSLRRSLAAWAIVSVSVVPWVAQVFLLKMMYPTRYPYPHFWPWFVVLGLAAADLWGRSESWSPDLSRRKSAAAAAVLFVAGPMLYQSGGMLFATRRFLHERDVFYLMRSTGHVGHGVGEAIEFLEDEAKHGGPFVLLTDPIWATPADAMAPFLNGKHGIRVHEAWWTQLSGTHPIMPPGKADLIRSHYERVKAGSIDFQKESRVYYVTDTAYYTPSAVSVRQPTAKLLKRFAKPEDEQSVDVYRLK